MCLYHDNQLLCRRHLLIIQWSSYRLLLLRLFEAGVNGKTWRLLRRVGMMVQLDWMCYKWRYNLYDVKLSDSLIALKPVSLQRLKQGICVVSSFVFWYIMDPLLQQLESAGFATIIIIVLVSLLFQRPAQAVLLLCVYNYL